ncbi:E1-E2 ATPase [Musa troglodytarum]|uniref:Phospholipid-transporting ATPase n=1 Tax=Musa troglodytarum TaxID=320322 RepID=A0A9E7K1U8_9LILI|nr:E1-E2 ATPase [Musa troglodytarum]
MADGERTAFGDLLRPIADPPVRPDLISLSASATAAASAAVDPPHGSRSEADRLGASLKELADADARIVFVGDPGRTDPGLALPGNAVRTAKYSFLTFIPRNLFEQFRRLAYVYFLAIAVLNQLPQLAVFGRGASVLPLAFVLLVTAVKDAYEDWRRHRSDLVENGRAAPVLDPAGSGQFRPRRWKDLRVGEVIKVLADESIPCDMVLLATSDPTGVAYVQTINLDGESNLKTRYAKQETMSRLPSITAGSVTTLIRCETPNRNIYGFHANLEVDGKRVSLGASNIILRGCELKNTAWAIGVAVYTGNETKVMLNSSGATSKRSRLETHMNRETLLLSAILITLCSAVSICNGIWLAIHRDELELSQYFRKRDYSGGDEKYYNYYGIAMQVFFIFLMAVIVFQIMIPISLYISMELVRLGQAYFMIRDKNLYDESSNSRFQCRALNINEDLGQIRYVFSDKTGTLTENKMVFQCASIRGIDYSEGKDPSPNGSDVYCVVVGDQFWRPKMLVKTDPKLVRLLRSEGETQEGKHARDFFLALAACNTIVPLIVGTPDPKQKLIDYQGESPDEQALVYAAAAYGIHSPLIVLGILGGRCCQIKIKIRRAKYTYICRITDRGDCVLCMLGCALPCQCSTSHGIGFAFKTQDFWPFLSHSYCLCYRLQLLSSTLTASGFIACCMSTLTHIYGRNIFTCTPGICRFNVLGLHEFDSDRKRMSVIIGCPDRTVRLFVKGADSSMFGVLEKSIDLDIIRATETNLHAYSSVGLRTLVVGMRELSRNDFEEWQSTYEKASTALYGRGSLLRAVASSVENNLQILGASGIEDKLQQGVPEAIESLRQAGIRVWVLTGDKQETAISIGYSCKLLTSEMTHIVINSNSEASCRKSLEDAIAISSKFVTISSRAQNTITGSGSARVPLALIIDGTSLVHILETELEEKLFKIATVCDVVLCCRVAPLQKAGIVALIKKRTEDMTLAIGDGANDVSMIQMADVGIGISGQEGRQAVMASDFAMGQFRFLVPLLLVHGHWNYQRIAYMILYNFYRNAVFVFIMFWYVLYTAYTLTTAITEWSSVLYSVLYSALPTVVVGILDKDLSRRTLLEYPKLYGNGQREESYNLKLFILTMMDAIWQSLVVFFIPYMAYRDTTVDGSSLGDLWTLAVVTLVNIHLAMDVFRWNWITHLSIWGSIAVAVMCVILIDSMWFLPGYWAIYHIMKTGLFWLCLLGIFAAGMIPRFTMKALAEYFMLNDIQISRELEKFGNFNDFTGTEISMSTFSQTHPGFIR